MAVYTEVSDDEIASFIALYGCGDLLSFRGIAEGVENTNYMVHTTSGPLILTLYEKRVNEADLPYFLNLLDHLAAHDVSCPVPLRDSTGSALNPLAGRQAALVTFLEGFWPRKPTPKHCHNVGKALAALHLAGQTFDMHRDNALSLDGWQTLFHDHASDIGAIAPELDKEIERELVELRAHWPTGLPSGVIHADLFPDNVFFLNDELSGVIDFYFACNDAFAYDLAICLNAWCFETDYAFNITKGRALFAGYESVRQLTADETTAMPILARGAATRFLLTRCADWVSTPAGALVKPHNPLDYLRRLRFHQTADTINAYGRAA